MRRRAGGRLPQRLPDATTSPDRAGPGAVHAVLRRGHRRGRGRPDRLPARRRRRSSSSPTPPTPPRSSAGSRGGAARGGGGRRRAPDVRRPRRAGPALRASCWGGSASRRPRLHVLRRRRAGGPPVVVCRTGYTGETGYELLPALGRRRRLWDALLAAGADLGVLPCGLGARDTLRTEMGYPLHGQDLSLDITPGAGALRAGRWAGPSRPSGAATPCSPSARPGRAGCCGGCESLGRAIPRPHMTVLRDGDAGRRGDQRHLLPDPAGGHRAGAARPRGRRGRRAGGRRPRPPRAGARRPPAVRRTATR